MVAYVWQGYARIAEEEFKTQQSGGITTEADPYPNHPQMVRNLPTDGLKNSCHLTGKLRHFLELHTKEHVPSFEFESCSAGGTMCTRIKPLPTFLPRGSFQYP